jgi:KDO2-lipid IV(A) lauroyltransferase
LSYAPIPFKLKILNRKRKVFVARGLDNSEELPLFTRKLVKISFQVPIPLSHRLQYRLLSLFALVLRVLPRKFRSYIGAGLGQVIYSIGIRKKVTQQNIAAAFPTMPQRGIRELSARVYRHFGRVAVSFVELPRLKPQDVGQWIDVKSFAVLDQAIRLGKGGIVFSGHLGNWEIMGAIVAQCGYPVTFVVANQSNRLVEDMIDRYRMAAGIEIYKRKDAVRGVLTALKRNRLVALLVDQDAHEDGAFVPFFGRLASTPRGPAVFHIRSGSPLIYADCIRLPGERYRIQLQNLDTSGCTDPDEITARMTAILESAIRNTPEQWLWMHRRWKTRQIES